MIDKYLNLDLRLFGCEKTADGMQFSVQVEDCPIGPQEGSEISVLTNEMRARLVQLELRKLDLRETIRLGTELGNLLLPSTARQFFTHSLSKLQSNQGLRVCLKCSGVELAQIPWEFAYVQRGLEIADQATGKRGFLVSDTRISVVRYELGAKLVTSPKRRGRQRLLAVLCDPKDRRGSAPALNIEEELAHLKNAMSGLTGFELVNCARATRSELHSCLMDGGADVFHFAGHGEFRCAQVGGVPSAFLVLQRDDGTSDEWQVDDLARSLANRGIRLAVLGACRSAQTDGLNSWAGIAPSLVRAGIPSVIGMQFTVFDVSAIAFSKVLYEAWPKVATIDEAVAEARSAILNLPQDTGRDFATPVLYYRPSEEQPESSGPIVVVAPPTPPAPAPVPASAPAPSAIEVDFVLRQIAEIYDYKQAHEALHSARTRAFNLVQIRRDEFPGGSTVKIFAMHGGDLRKTLQDLRRIQGNGLCEKQLMTEILQEFEDAQKVFDESLRQQSGDMLDDAIASFDSLLSTFPARIDTCMALLAAKVDLGVLAKSLVSVSLSAVASEDRAAAMNMMAADIEKLGNDLRNEARRHNLCQNVDTKLAVIRKATEDRRFKEILRHWKPMSDSLSKILVDWNPLGGETLKTCSEQLGNDIANNDEQASRSIFDQFCVDFDYGFFTVDTDFKDLCGKVNAKAIQTVSHIRSGGIGAP